MASAHGCTKHSSKGRPRHRCRRRDCGGKPRARETHPYPHAGLSKRRDHARKRSQLGDSSAEGQPRGGRSKAFLKGPPRRRYARRGQIQPRGSGTVAPGRFAGSTARPRHGVRRALAPWLPQLGCWLPGTRRTFAPASSVRGQAGRLVSDGRRGPCQLAKKRLSSKASPLRSRW